MRRREFIGLAAGAAMTRPFAVARAQQSSAKVGARALLTPKQHRIASVHCRPSPYRESFQCIDILSQLS
jgi:hypothetical protein